MNIPALPQQFTEAWIRSESSARNSVNVKMLYIDINDGNLVDGILFSQIMYWHGFDEKGKSRLKIEKDGEMWIAKRYSEWWEECRIDERAARDSVDRMVKRGLIIKAVYGFGGKPTVHIRLNPIEFCNRATGQMPNPANDATRQMQTEQMTPAVISNTEITPDTDTTESDFSATPEKQKAQMPEAAEKTATEISAFSKPETSSPPVPPPPSLVKPKPSKPPEPTTEQINAMATITTIGLMGLAVKEQRSWVLKAVRGVIAMEPTATPERIMAFGRWWMKNDWRGQKGQRPQPNQVTGAWSEFTQKDKSNENPKHDPVSTGNNGNGETRQARSELPGPELGNPFGDELNPRRSEYVPGLRGTRSA